MPRRDQRLTVKDKLAILVEAERGTVKGTAHKHGVQPSQIRRWRRDKVKLKATRARNPNARSTAPERAVSAPALEDEVAAWITERRAQEIAVSTAHVIAKALSIDAFFKEKSRSTLRHWVYPFLARHQLSIRRRTHVGQKLNGHLQSVRDEFVDAVNERFQVGGSLEGLPPELVANMDETTVYYDQTSRTTIAPTGSRTVSIRGSGSNSQRLTACITCTMDGGKLPPLFLVFKAKPDGIIERSLDRLLPPGVFGCCQENGWMDERGCRIWVDKVWAPYVRGRETSLLLLDEFKCHMQSELSDRLSDVGTDLMIIPGGYTSVLQPCDVGINKPLKDKLREWYEAWSADRMDGVAADAKVPVPRCEDIITWLVDAWSRVTEQSIRDTFRKIGLGSNNTPAHGANSSSSPEDDADELVEEAEMFRF